MELWLHLIDTLALLGIVYLLASGRLVGPQGRDGIHGREGLDGAPGEDGLDGAPGKDGASGKEGKDGAPGKTGLDGAPGKDDPGGEARAAAPAVPAPMVQILRDGVPYHRVSAGSRYHQEALAGRRGLSVRSEGDV